MHRKVTAEPAPRDNHPKERHLDRSGGRPHRPPRSGETPVFRSCRCSSLPRSISAVVYPAITVFITAIDWVAAVFCSRLLFVLGCYWFLPVCFCRYLSLPV